MINHLRCRRVKERDIEFDSHMSGFVYKVVVDGQILIKKEIPGPDTVEEFLYEINALCRLRDSENVIQFYGVIVDDHDAHVKGLLISYAEKGALIDVIYDHNHTLPWATREKWARQIVDGLSDIHEAGFVQGDFTLSNIVIDADDNAKIIDINRRGCPVGWEPPEATPLIECNQRITMYIGVKSDLFQLGMVLWALATQEDEPETQGRPLTLDDEPDIPPWYRRMVDICLSENPCLRLQASALRSFFPDPVDDYTYHRHMAPAISVDGTYADFGRRYDMYDGKNTAPQIRTVEPRSDWPISSMGHKYVDPATAGFHEPYYYPTRGRSPPRSRTPSSYSRHLSYPANAVPVSDTSDATSAVDIDAADLERSKSATPRTMHDSQIVLEKPREQSVAAPEEADDKAPAPASLLLSDEQKIDRIQQVATDDGPHYRAPTPPPPPPDVSVGQDVADATLGQQSGGDNEVDLAAVPTTPCDDAPAKDLGSTEPDKITSEHDVLESTPIERSGVTEALDEERIVGPTDDPIPPSIPQPQNNGQGDDTTVTTTIEATNQAALSPPALLPAELTGVGDQYYEMSLEQKMLEASLADDPIFTIGGESEGLTATAGLT